MTEIFGDKVIKPAAEWTAENPILPLGMEGMESNTRYTKLGDGITSWSSLSYTTQPGAKYINDRSTSNVRPVQR